MAPSSCRLACLSRVRTSTAIPASTTMSTARPRRLRSRRPALPHTRSQALLFGQGLGLTLLLSASAPFQDLARQHFGAAGSPNRLLHRPLTLGIRPPSLPLPPTRRNGRPNTSPRPQQHNACIVRGIRLGETLVLFYSRNFCSDKSRPNLTQGRRSYYHPGNNLADAYHPPRRNFLPPIHSPAELCLIPSLGMSAIIIHTRFI